ncbi:hypothetical protein [Pseudarthrobacter sp. ATCC 49987]|uniref:hypothetical protein n=1 Tax=Pseudarthrobacter sp. ATCC 49987 TaxID=2698204 RepID=UPI001F19FEFC|nr:hypothetical protein [Pseudarthrobacter sp. ATCC 49987]
MSTGSNDRIVFNDSAGVYDRCIADPGQRTHVRVLADLAKAAEDCGAVYGRAAGYKRNGQSGEARVQKDRVGHPGSDGVVADSDGNGE